MKLLGKKHVGKTRCKDLEIVSNKKYIKCREYYTERLVAEFSTETQSHNFGGNNYLSIGGVALEYYKKYYEGKVLTKNIVNELIGKFNSYLYDNIKQYT